MNCKSLTLLLLLLVPALASSLPAASKLKTQATLLSEQESIAPGQRFSVALRFQIAEHWHTYWRNAGDAGLATKITWDLPPGFVAGEIQWPTPQRLDLGAGIVNFGYEGDVWHLVEIQAPQDLKPGQTLTFQARVDWLECEEICQPGQADLTLKIKSAAESRANPALSAAFQKAAAKSRSGTKPRPFPPPARAIK
ncbi:MAG: hypothetical protein HC904_07500 [Blastochloris sp.]|nr:hypothetical protein [Blastochloris sp.]